MARPIMEVTPLRPSRPSIAAAAALCIFASVAVNAPAFAESGESAGSPDERRIRRGFAIAPVELNLRGLNRAMVGLGSYLVNAVGGCNDCHTNPPFEPGGNPFDGEPARINVDGYLAGGMSFGPFVSRNITPFKDGKPGGLTYRQFFNVMRFGKDPDRPSRLLQVMPWPLYRHMTDSDIRAIYEYLRAIPPIRP